MNNVINIYCVYEIQPISSSRDTTFNIQNALFGASQITKNADTSKYDYKGYGICFDEGGTFSHKITEDGRAHTTMGRNAIIFGVDMSSSIIRLIEQIIFTLWVKDLYKVFMTLRYMQKKAIGETLQILVKNI